MKKETKNYLEGDCGMCVSIQLKKLSNTLCRRRANDPIFKRARILTGTHGWVLNFLVETQGAYQRDIEKRFNMRRSTATKMLQVMEKNGLIVRTVEAADNRLKLIKPTAVAAEINQSVINQMTVLNEVMQRGISHEEIATFCRLIDKMIENINQDEEVANVKNT